MQCPYCFTLVDEGKQLCPECGALLTPPSGAAGASSASVPAAAAPSSAGEPFAAPTTPGAAPWAGVDTPTPDGMPADTSGPVPPEETLPLPPAPPSFWKRRAGLIVALIAFVLVSLSVAIYAGYRSGEAARREKRQQVAAEHYQLGMDAFNAGDYAKAIAEFEYVLKLDPENSLAKVALEQARAAYNFSLTPTPVNIEEQLQRLYDEGRAAYVAGDWTSAARVLAQLRALDGTFKQPEVNDMLFSALYNAGMSMLNQDQLEAAIFYFDQALALRPGDAATQEQRSLAALYVEALRLWGADWEGCIARLTELYNRNPNYRDTRARLAQAYEAYGDTFADKGEFCPALQHYTTGMKFMELVTLRPKQEAAGQKCAEATPTPGPSPTPTQTPAVTPTAQPGFLRVGQLAFTRYNDVTGLYDLYVLYAGGEEIAVAAGADHPWLEWGGARVVYRDRVQGGLWIAQPGVGQPMALRTETNLAWPALSPDRQRLAYAAVDSNSVWRVYVAPIDGSSAPLLVAEGWAPAWGPNDLLAYTGCLNDECGIYVTRPGSAEAPVRLTTSENDMAAAWSPDGERIAYMTLAHGNWDVMVVDLAGTIRPLVAEATNEGLPTWSPDGDEIAFVSQRWSTWSVYVVRSTGGKPTKLLDLGTMPANWIYQRIYWAP